ncbi:MAG: toprim domain-containing protein [Synergistaceae bacterium]|nr:toprim domain-containing protein [Synergistaceae bacterium]
MGLDRIAYIKERYSVLEYARDVLGLPVRKAGDRCKSIAPGPHKTNNAFVVYEDWWYDFSAGCGGDVIDLCAEAKHGGDKGEAIRELAGDYGGNWMAYTDNLCNKIAYFHSQLRECDRLYLYRRGIKKETVDRLRLGYDEKEDRLIIPYYKNGYVAYYIGRDRSENPEASKYKKARLDGLNENIAWGLHTFDPKHREAMQKNVDGAKKAVLEKYCVITEGAFDAMSFEQEGFKVLSPISGYFSKEALKQVISQCKTQECVYLCFDSDSAGTKFQVNMAQMLFRHRVKFVCGTLPDGYKDVSEYYADGGDLFGLVGRAKPGIAMLAGRITDRDEFKKFVYESARFVDEPDLAELFENTHQFPKAWLAALLKKALRPPIEKMIIQEILSARSLKYVEGLGFYEYAHGVWQKRADNLIRNYLAGLLGYWASGSKLETLLRYLKAETTTEELFNRQAVFNFRNCVLELPTGEKKKHNPSYMSSVQALYDYDETADCPKWKKFVSEVMAGREASMKLLQEMTGYILYTDSSLQKCFFLMGDGANGKSVFLNVIRAVFGEANVSNVEMSSLIEPFQRINLINSLVNISTETSSNVKGAESIFKQIVVGDTINGCYKNKDFVNFNPRCVMISACNEYIKSRDTTSGFLRRICFIDFPCKFEGKKADTELESKLKAELPGIFNWAYEGYKRLCEQKKFTETPEQLVMMDEFVQIMNPVAAFIRECLTGRTGLTERSKLYEEYTAWCKGAGHEAQSRNKFMQNFRKTIGQMMPHVCEVKSGSTRYFEFTEEFEGRPASDFMDDEEDDRTIA